MPTMPTMVLMARHLPKCVHQRNHSHLRPPSHLYSLQPNTFAVSYPSSRPWCPPVVPTRDRLHV